MLEHVRPGDSAGQPDSAGERASPPLPVPILSAPRLPDLHMAETRAQRSDTRRHRRALLAACALHVALLAAVLLTWSQDSVGTAGQSLDAISVEITLLPASGLAALQAKTPGQDTPTADAAPDAAAAKPETSPPEPDTRPPAPAPTVAATPDPAPPAPDALDVREPAKAEPPPEPEPREATKPTTDPAETRTEAPARRAAPAAAPPAAAQAPQAAARPSPGAVQAYARSVVAALSATRPKPAAGMARGTVRISFSIAEAGFIERLQVAQSSGHSSLDDVAVAAVRKASFSAPPAGMTPSERTFVIPYHFR